MKIKGLDKLLGFERACREVPRALRQAEEATMRDWLARATKQFDTETDPYGAKWAARKRGGAPVLTGKRKKLRSLKLRRLTGHRWAIVTAGADVLPFHQKGTSRMKRRRVFPDKGLPKAWRAAGVRVFRAKLKEHFR